MNRLAFAALALVAAFGLGWWQGAKWQANRFAAEQLKQQNKQVQEARDENEREVERLKEIAEKRGEAQQLEDAANARPIDDNCGIRHERVRRLNLR